METLNIRECNLKQNELLAGREIVEIVEIYTSPFEDNCYRKHYMCTDGFELWEVNRVIQVNREVKLSDYGVEIIKNISVRMYEHEMWSSKTKSIFSYEYLD